MHKLAIRIRLLELKVYRRRRYLRKRRGKWRHGRIRPHAYNFYKNRIEYVFTASIREFFRLGYINKLYVRKYIEVPRHFSFKNDFRGSIVMIQELLSTFFLGNGFPTVDFSNCIEIGISSLTLLDILTKEMYRIRDRYNNGIYKKIEKRIRVIPSKYSLKANKYLLAFDFAGIQNEIEDGSEYLPLRLHTGKRKNFRENKKGVTCRKIVDFINESSRRLDVEFNKTGINAMDNMITEILSNAEDHSIANSEWYVNGISFLEFQHQIQVVEINLAIINFGASMYDAFEKTKKENCENYELLERQYAKHKRLFTKDVHFERESLFMLYMLNEGISRLKYKESSRGNGTMQFLESFITLGGFGNDNPNFNSQLNIISGHSVLTCDNNCGPYEDDNHKKLSLNKEKSLTLLPDKDYMSYTESKPFPGTVLECKIYLNRDFFNKILSK